MLNERVVFLIALYEGQLQMLCTGTKTLQLMLHALDSVKISFHVLLKLSPSSQGLTPVEL